MNLWAHIKNTVEMMKEEFVVLFLGGCVVQLLISFSLGILSGPIMGGYLLAMIRWLETGRRTDINDIFSGMKRFGELLPFFFMMLLVLFGYILVFAPGIFLTVLWIYVLPLMAHRRLSLGQAMKLSKDKVFEKGFFIHIVFLLLISMVPLFVIYAAAVVVPPLVVLQYFLFPLQCGCLASLYLEQFTGFDPETRKTTGNETGVLQVSADSSSPPPVPTEHHDSCSYYIRSYVLPA